ncbi:ribosomal protein L44 [Rhizoctonia solani]|uniref:Large ribosomal subunit protein eL42 n=1 Tax=Rhizoctonia solani TaxID=456999 RepID=A0A8H8P465_9AGAM|nr:ribosomal protein L44 [Rhizoctonia solani]QRW23498.1 ribosomal protein L44 [Rhizoctonia solani]
MILPERVQRQISTFSRRLRQCQAELKLLNAEERIEEHDVLCESEFMSIFRDTCILVQEEHATSPPYLTELTSEVQKIHNRALGYAYGIGDLYDFMPSWAHDDAAGRALIVDRSEGALSLPHATIPMMLEMLNIDPETAMQKVGKILPDPWNLHMKRHPKSTLLSRFRPDLPPLTATPSSPLAASVYDARCEVTSIDSILPTKLRMSSGSSCLAMTGTCGHKNRTPGLNFCLPDDSLGVRFLNPELSDVATQLTMDEDSQMIYVGDRSHVKSFAWGDNEGPYRFLYPVYTLDSKCSDGPIAVLPGGRVVRAGAGGVALWNTDELEMQGCDAETVIGDQSDPEEASHGGTSDTLFSSSIPRSSFIRFTDIPNLTPTVWEPLPNNPSTLLCAEYFELIKYGCVSIDLEYSGKTMARYLGHGGAVSDFSVSATDSQMFLTACHDGYARLFDIRQPLPVITLDACGADAFCEAVVLAHPDGIPTVFTGTGKHEQIKVWDIRACTPIYELATGNNAVKSLAWDSKRNCLYAATECAYMDRMGRHYDYRPGRVPSQSSQEGEASYEEDYDRCWPFEAWHAEDYFGYTFDAGDHRIFRYAFKEDPNTSILPASRASHDSPFGLIDLHPVRSPLVNASRPLADDYKMVNIPKTRRTSKDCKGKTCKKHTPHKVTQYKKGKDSIFAQGKRRYDRKQSGYGGQTKPVFHKKAKTTKKVVLRLECTVCKYKMQLALKRCKHFELGGDKKTKGAALQF